MAYQKFRHHSVFNLPRDKSTVSRRPRPRGTSTISSRSQAGKRKFLSVTGQIPKALSTKARKHRHTSYVIPKGDT